MVDTKKIFELKTQINELLKEKPELQVLQNKIDLMLSNAGSQHNRCILIQQMMIDSIKELYEITR